MHPAVRREPGRKTGLLFVTLLMASWLAGCASGGGGGGGGTAPGPAREMAEPAAPLNAGDVVDLPSETATTATPASPGGAGSATPARPTSTSTSTTAPAGIDATTTSQAPAPAGSQEVRWRRVASIGDPARDVGTDAPGFADVVGVAVDVTPDEVRVAVALRSDVQATLAAEEVVGLGFDIFRTGSRESDYQLFVDGGPEGWFSYLQTPTGFVEFPGTLHVGQRQIVLAVPRRSIGGPGEVEFSVFLDYTKERPIRNIVTSDRAPDAGRSSMTL